VDLLTIFQVVLRRWYVALPVLIVALLAAATAQANVPPRYEARGSVLLTEPELDPSGLAAVVVNLNDLRSRLGAEALAEELSTGGAEYVVQIDDVAMTVTSFATDATSAEATTDAVIERFVAEVESAQVDAEIPETERLRATVLTPLISAIEQPDGTFEATGRVGLADPTAGVTNPYGADNTTGRVLEVTLMSDVGRERVAARTEPGIEFQVVQNLPDAAPILEITTFGEDQTAVLAAFGEIRDVIAEELERRQERAAVPSTRRVDVEMLAEPRSVTDVSPLISRGVAAIVALGLVLAPLLALLTERLALASTDRRATRRSAPTSPSRTDVAGAWRAPGPPGGDEPVTGRPEVLVETPEPDGRARTADPTGGQAS
jgi:capsular polysaccharide biosynthesis protein